VSLEDKTSIVLATPLDSNSRLVTSHVQSLHVRFSWLMLQDSANVSGWCSLMLRNLMTAHSCTKK